MASKIPEPGERIGSWTVLGFEGGRNSLVRVQCQCGHTTRVRLHSLRNGKSQSCGCIRPPLLPPGEPGFRALLRDYKRNAREHGRIWELSVTRAQELFSGPCVYCGLPPATVKRAGAATQSWFTYNGIDRIDSSRGYVDDNVVSCCPDCNRAKLDMSRDEFLEMVRRIYLHSLQRSVV